MNTLLRKRCIAVALVICFPLVLAVAHVIHPKTTVTFTGRMETHSKLTLNNPTDVKIEFGITQLTGVVTPGGGVLIELPDALRHTNPTKSGERLSDYLTNGALTKRNEGDDNRPQQPQSWTIRTDKIMTLTKTPDPFGSNRIILRLTRTTPTLLYELIVYPDYRTTSAVELSLQIPHGTILSIDDIDFDVDDLTKRTSIGFPPSASNDNDSFALAFESPREAHTFFRARAVDGVSIANVSAKVSEKGELPRQYPGSRNLELGGTPEATIEGFDISIDTTEKVESYRVNEDTVRLKNWYRHWPTAVTSLFWMLFGFACARTGNVDRPSSEESSSGSRASTNALESNCYENA